MKIKKCNCHCGCDYKLEDYGKDEKMCGACLDNCLEECFHDSFKNSKVELVELVDEMEIEVECENCGKKGTINYSYTSDNWK